MFVSQSFAKNMGLYGERVGALHIVVPNKDITEKVMSQIKYTIFYSGSSSDKSIQVPPNMEQKLLLPS